jgi:hypothetical protein
MVSALQHVLATISGHHHAALIESLSSFSAVPTPLANVYNWWKVILLFTMYVIDLNKYFKLY